MNKKLKAILGNLVFLSFLVMGTFFGIEGAENISVFLVWLGFLISLFCFSDEIVEHAQKSGALVTPLWMFLSLKGVYLLIMLWFGWILTAVVHAMSTFMFLRLYLGKPNEKNDELSKAG